jgi:asparagine synthase (glutamine-hydrolysing)
VPVRTPDGAAGDALVVLRCAGRPRSCPPRRELTISAIVAAHGPFDPAEGARMLDRLTHRGPDGEGTLRLPHAWLGHRRLAIVDLADGGQPLHDPDRGLWLVGDGEVYDHARLRTELEARGHSFRTSSDHETILHLLTADGPAALSRLWGMFAVVAAGEDGSFVVARDRIGIAPLYWVRDGGTVVFASELKAFDPQRRSDVEPFPPGHTWSPDAGLQAIGTLPPARTTRITDVIHAVEDGEDPPDAVFAAIRDTLIAAVERCMVADVPLGTLLSGGLDSSIVTAIAARIAEREGWQLPTFSVGLAGSEDLAAARQLASALGTAHHERVYTEDELIDWVPEVVRVIESFDPQLVHSSVPNLLVAKLAARHVKVVLIGEGADELFAGYSHYGQIEDGEELHQALVDTIGGLHAGGLQRVDRVAGANGLEARIPFLDLDLVELGLALPARWKLTRDRPEKWLLRRAFDGWLPDELLWRRKAQFGEGTGARAILRAHYGALVDQDTFERGRAVIAPPLRTPEEAAYHALFQQHLTGMDPEGVVGRFVEP